MKFFMFLFYADRFVTMQGVTISFSPFLSLSLSVESTCDLYKWSQFHYILYTIKSQFETNL